MIPMEELTVSGIRRMLENGQATSRELVLNYMERIARIDKSGPMLNSVLELNPDALYIAEAMDRERAKGKVRSPLHGIPILLKDNINTRDKMRRLPGPGGQLRPLRRLYRHQDAPGGAGDHGQDQHDGAGQLDELSYAQRLQLPGRPGHQSL